MKNIMFLQFSMFKSFLATFYHPFCGRRTALLIFPQWKDRFHPDQSLISALTLNYTTFLISFFLITSLNFRFSTQLYQNWTSNGFIFTFFMIEKGIVEKNYDLILSFSQFSFS